MPEPKKDASTVGIPQPRRQCVDQVVSDLCLGEYEQAHFSTVFCGKQFVGMYRPALPPIDSEVQPAAAIKQLDFIPCVVVFISCHMHIK